MRERTVACMFGRDKDIEAVYQEQRGRVLGEAEAYVELARPDLSPLLREHYEEYLAYGRNEQ